jgi:hypothetical protein
MKHEFKFRNYLFKIVNNSPWPFFIGIIFTLSFYFIYKYYIIYKNLKEANKTLITINLELMNKIKHEHNIDVEFSEKLKMEIIEELNSNKLQTFKNSNVYIRYDSLYDKNRQIFELYLISYIDYNPLEINITYNSEIIANFYIYIGNKEISSNSLYKMLKEYILKKYCNNNISKIEEMKSKSKSKPAYYKGIYLIKC